MIEPQSAFADLDKPRWTQMDHAQAQCEEIAARPFNQATVDSEEAQYGAWRYLWDRLAETYAEKKSVSIVRLLDDPRLITNQEYKAKQTVLSAGNDLKAGSSSCTGATMVFGPVEAVAVPLRAAFSYLWL